MDIEENTTQQEQKEQQEQLQEQHKDLGLTTITQCGVVKVVQDNTSQDPNLQPIDPNLPQDQQSKPKIAYQKMGQDLPIDINQEELHFVGKRIGKLEGVEANLNMTVLCLRNNLITKIEGIANNTQLVELELYDNKLTKIEGLETLVNLRILDLSYNNIKKIEGLDTLKKVEKLYLLSNKIKVIENLDFPELTMLELGSNKIDKIQNLNKLPKLNSLYLGKNRIQLIENLEPLKDTLEIIALTANRISVIGNGIKPLVNLTELYIAENFITQIDSLEYFPNLYLLDLSMNKIKKLEGIQNLKTLTELWLNVNDIENFSDLDVLVENPLLETVYLATNPVSRFPSYRQKLMEICPNIQQIDATPIHISYNIKKS